eukprot:1195280-Rhodomonas_salina.2
MNVRPYAGAVPCTPYDTARAVLHADRTLLLPATMRRLLRLLKRCIHISGTKRKGAWYLLPTRQAAAGRLWHHSFPGSEFVPAIRPAQYRGA